MNRAKKLTEESIAKICGIVTAGLMGMVFYFTYIQPKYILPEIKHDAYLIEKIENRVDKNNDGVLQTTEIADLLKKDFGYEGKINQNGDYRLNISDKEKIEVSANYGRADGYDIFLPRKTVEKLVE